MKKYILASILIIAFQVNYGQNYRTYYGDYLYPIDTFRVLNFFINIIFDQCDTCDPYPDPAQTPLWIPGPTNTINTSPPTYLATFMDRDFNPNIIGTFTKRYAQASFNKFIVLGDHVIVNIAQSRVTPNNPDTYFGYTTLLDAAVKLINEKGGLQTVYGHNNRSNYDCIDARSINRFLPKPQNLYNNNIDFIQVYMRNSIATRGGLTSGGNASINMTKYLKFLNGDSCKNELGTVQGAMGNLNLANPMINANDIHEMAHNLLGMTNSIHMGGGGPVNEGDLVTLEFNSGGWSIISSANSSLVTCNGFERWRLNWIGPTNNNIPIAVNSVSSDIKKADGPKTFYLRDFITYGDAVRFKLPYVDANALNQYIWLENHRLKINNSKEDYPYYCEETCKDDGVPGIYAYYQVGKDIREEYIGRDSLLPSLTDHLVPICAEGNWDITLGTTDYLSCVGSGLVNIQEYYQENPLSGYNDLENHYFNSISGNTINWKYDRIELLIKKKNGVVTDKLANSGDNEDPFTGTKYISLSTNPAPVNVITYHHKQYAGGIIDTTTTLTDNRKIHLSGLRIDFTDQPNAVMKVDIRWNDYDVTKDVRWTGDIILHEKVNLTSGKTITFDQNYTPNKHIRDNVTGQFAGPTYFTCLGNSSFIMQSTSKVILQNLSSFILESGSRLEINDGAIFTVKSGSTLQVKAGANLLVKGSGRIEIENGGYLCIQNSTLNDTLLNNLSVINLRPGYHLGVNTSVLTDPGTCKSQPNQITFKGTGSVNTYNTDIYVQNITFTADKYYAGNNIYVGYNVTSPPYGNVVIPNGVKVIFDAAGEIKLNWGFDAANGSGFEFLKYGY
jgi:hypothetical protein